MERNDSLLNHVAYSELSVSRQNRGVCYFVWIVKGSDW